jgi:hypothetical protein
LWKCAIEHHTFFRLKFHRPPKQARAQLFRLGSTFKYRGRTEYENVHKDSKPQRRPGGTFERRPSQRYVPRQSYLQKQKFRADMRQQAILNNSVQKPLFDEQNKDFSMPASSSSSAGAALPPLIHKNSAALSPETRLDNLIAGQSANISQLSCSPNALRRIPGSNDKILLSSTPPITVPLQGANGMQKPSTNNKAVSSFASVMPTTGVHVTTIEINEKGANVFNGNNKVRKIRFNIKRPSKQAN